MDLFKIFWKDIVIYIISLIAIFKKTEGYVKNKCPQCQPRIEYCFDFLGKCNLCAELPPCADGTTFSKEDCIKTCPDYFKGIPTVTPSNEKQITAPYEHQLSTPTLILRLLNSTEFVDNPDITANLVSKSSSTSNYDSVIKKNNSDVMEITHWSPPISSFGPETTKIDNILYTSDDFAHNTNYIDTKKIIGIPLGIGCLVLVVMFVVVVVVVTTWKKRNCNTSKVPKTDEEKILLQNLNVLTETILPGESYIFDWLDDCYDNDDNFLKRFAREGGVKNSRITDIYNQNSNNLQEARHDLWSEWGRKKERTFMDIYNYKPNNSLFKVAQDYINKKSESTQPEDEKNLV